MLYYKKERVMRRIVLTIEYMGTAFSGFQIQPGKRTVQGEIEDALGRILDRKAPIFASGRTDAGVHALGLVLHFDTEKTWQAVKFRDQLNLILPSDISVVDSRDASPDFDARFDCKEKTYGLRFYLSRYERPLFENRSLRVNDNVDIGAMKEACQYFVGRHDFRSFVARKSGKTDFEREIYSCFIHKINSEEFEFVVSGSGFLYNMVRIMFGTVLRVGEGKLKPAEIIDVINSKSRSSAGRTVPPHGLYLLGVKY